MLRRESVEVFCPVNGVKAQEVALCPRCNALFGAKHVGKTCPLCHGKTGVIAGTTRGNYKKDDEKKTENLQITLTKKQKENYNNLPKKEQVSIKEHFRRELD